MTDSQRPGKANPKIEWGFFAITPRIVRTKYKQLSHTEKWLYSCLKDLCGDKGTCFRSLRTLSEETDISTGSLSAMIPRLHMAGLIHAEKKSRGRGGKEVWHISIVDIWQANREYCSEIEQLSKEDVQNLNSGISDVQKLNDTAESCSEFERSCSNFVDRRIQSKNKDTEEQESTYTQAANALAQSTHETANGESDAPTPTLSGHLPGDASDTGEHHVLPAIPGIPGDHRSTDVSVDPQIAPPSDEVSNIPTFSTPPTDEVSLLVLPPNTSSNGRVEHKAAPASGAKPQRKPKVATGKQSTIGQARIAAIIDCMDATIQQLTGDPQFCFSRSKKAQDIIWDTLIKDRKEGQGVTPTMLRATITRMYNTPKDNRSGFDWKENMSIAAICNNFDKFSIGLAAKQPPKVAPIELDAEALEEERRRLEFAIKHAERWAKPAPMAQPQHAVVPIVAKGGGR